MNFTPSCLTKSQKDTKSTIEHQRLPCDNRGEAFSHNLKSLNLNSCEIYQIAIYLQSEANPHSLTPSHGVGLRLSLFTIISNTLHCHP